MLSIAVLAISSAMTSAESEMWIFSAHFEKFSAHKNARMSVETMKEALFVFTNSVHCNCCARKNVRMILRPSLRGLKTRFDCNKNILELSLR